MNKPIDLGDKAVYDEPGSWGRLSQGWPEIKDHAYAKYVFCNMTGVVPYGSYVFMGGDRDGVLRVVDDHAVQRLNEKFDIVRRAILEEPQ